jgi:hypothetical protein
VKKQHSQIFIAIAALLLTSLACEPVIVIGWDELFIIFLVIAFLFGPLIFRFWRAYNKYKNESRKKK